MRKVVTLFFGFLAVLIMLFLGFGFYFAQQLRPVDSQQTGKVDFVIPRGQSLNLIGQRLQEQGLIRNRWAFRYIVWRDKLTTKVQAGSFMLSSAMSADEVAQQLTTGTNDVWITVLEGWRVEEIADLLADQELESFDRQQFLDLAKDQEGYLFPDSYLIPRSATAEMVFTLLRNTFDKKIKEGLSDEIAQSGKSLSQIVILASIVQREAREFDQMRLVSGILQNRLTAGMGLYVDATLQYAKGYDSALKTWWPQALASDKESSSPFNTYKVAGLPPHPISNPGLEAIRAILDPLKTSNLYYLHDNQGVIHTATTLEEHNQNVERYLR